MKSGSIHDDATFDGLLAWLPVLFVGLIALGLAALRLPDMLLPGQPLRPVEAVFTVTAAVCCTGLPLRDPAAQFSTQGLIALGLLTQLGAIIYMVAGAAVAFRLRARLEPGRGNPGAGGAGVNPGGATLLRLVLSVVGVTLAIELAAVAVVAATAALPADTPLESRLGWSLFHCVSAFCNAGWSLQENSLQDYRLSFLAHGAIAPLIVLGGLGYPVLSELAGLLIRRLKRTGGPNGAAAGAPPAGNKATATPASIAPRSVPRLSTYCRLVLTTTAIVYLAGLVGIFAGQVKPYLNEYFKQGFDWGQKRPGALTPAVGAALIADSSFTSVACRTTAFYTIPLDDRAGAPQFLQPAGRFLLMPLMAVGGTPGGTAGGIGTIAVALLVVAAVGMWRSRPQSVVARDPGAGAFNPAAWAGVVVLAYVTLVALAAFLLSLSEPFPTGRLLFDAVSAASSAGLALDSPRDMTAFGQWVMVGTILLARIGLPILMGRMLMQGQAAAPANPGAHPGAHPGAGAGAKAAGRKSGK